MARLAPMLIHDALDGTALLSTVSELHIHQLQLFV
jgi:hypothetical protein